VWRVLRFAIPSATGAFFFLFPIRQEGVYTIPLAILTDWANDWLADSLPIIAFALVVISAALTLFYSVIRSSTKSSASRMQGLFCVTTGWLLLRIAGLVVGAMIVFQIGPEFVWSESTGHVVLYELAAAIVTIFVFASFLLPLLTDFGLMELVGSALSRVFHFLFRLPGRSCIDAVASWMAAAPVGVLITSQQFESGNYSKREAATIATNFSIVSLPFCVVVARFAGMDHLFLQYYFTVCVAGLITAMILPRIPPLSRIPDEYAEVGRQHNEDELRKGKLLRAGYEAALRKADDAPSPRRYLQIALHNLFDIWFGLMPPLIAIGTLGMVLVEHTPVFTYLSWPFIPLLELMQLPEAATAAPALLVGFAEMFLPAVIATGIESELTRFVVIAVSITQLIYMTEVGVLILKTRIPLNFINLVTIFLLRTVISLPVIAALAHFFVPVSI
jgi:nucleoside recognition membrane protein YjiH